MGTSIGGRTGAGSGTTTGVGDPSTGPGPARRAAHQRGAPLPRPVRLARAAPQWTSSTGTRRRAPKVGSARAITASTVPVAAAGAAPAPTARAADLAAAHAGAAGGASPLRLPGDRDRQPAFGSGCLSSGL